MEAVELAGKRTPLNLDPLFGGRSYALHLFRLQMAIIVGVVDASERVLAELDAVFSPNDLKPPLRREETHLVPSFPRGELRLE